MKKLLRHFIVTLLILSLFPVPIQAQVVSPKDETESGSVVCAPADYGNAQDDCLLAGPAAYVAQMAELGYTFPERPLPALKPDPALTQLPYRYFKLENDIVPILSGAAGSETGQSFLPGFVYVSYIDRVDTGHGIYYMLQDGSWIPGKGSRIGEYSLFQGLQFKSTPRNSFAWPLPFYVDSIPVRTAPGYNSPQTDRLLYPYVDIVQVYDTQVADGVEWNMIAPGQWVEARILAQVTPNITPPRRRDDRSLDRCRSGGADHGCLR